MKVKCVVWDLDNTLWQGTLSEGLGVEIRPDAFKIVKALDDRGILQSVASKNNYDDAMPLLIELGIDKYFLYPQIHWGPKSQSIQKICEALNIGIDSFAFVDDQEFELEEVAFSLPEVMLINANNIDSILSDERFLPRFVTDDAKYRRAYYQRDISRHTERENFQGTEHDFLKTLDLSLTVSEATELDLQRAEELTIRTHQLNSTGYTYSYEELDDMRASDDFMLLVAELTDKFGSYGKIGLVLIHKEEIKWTIKLFLMSCRVMSRGVGSALLTLIQHMAAAAGNSLLAEFNATDRNRMMYMTYKFSGFNEVRSGVETLFKCDLDNLGQFPDYMNINNNI